MATLTEILVLYGRRVPTTLGLPIEMVARILGLTEPSPNDVEPSYLRRIFNRNSYESLAYVNDWLSAFREHARLHVDSLNIADLGDLIKAQRVIKRYPFIVLLHSAAGDELSVLRWLSGALKHRGGKVVIFFGNEYTKMAEKIAFAKDIEADFIGSQLPPLAAKWLYESCSSTKLFHAPAALNSKNFYLTGESRDIDLGFRGDRYPITIGDIDRTRVIEAVSSLAPKVGLNTDIRFERYAAESWNSFLNRCHGTVGAEAGTAFLERDDSTETAVRRYINEHPTVSFEEIYRRFFSGHVDRVSGKAISSRHFEAMGTGTCQLLLDGHYNGILSPNEHYLSIARDMSNLTEVLERFLDPEDRKRIVECATELVLSAHTYQHRIDSMLKIIADGDN